MNKSGIYCIKNTINGKVYVGSAVRFSKRWEKHRRLLCEGHHSNKHLQNAWNKYGKEVFIFYVLEYVIDPLQLVACEQIWINFLEAVSRGYNIRLIAQSNIGLKHSDKTKALMSSMRQNQSQKTKDKISASLMGRVRRPETRAKISESHKGMKHTLESRAKMSISQRNKVISDDVRARTSATMKKVWAKRKEQSAIP